MKGRTQHQNRRLTRVAMTMGVMLAVLPGSTTATDPLELPACSAIRTADVPDGVVVSAWEVLLDTDGAVTGHRMRLRRHGVETTVRTGRRGFSQDISSDRVLVGYRSDRGTSLTMIDTAQGCRSWTRSLDRLAYTLEAPDDGFLRLSIHEPETRDYEGTLLLDAETGATNAMIDGECATICQPNDGEVPPAAFVPASLPRPVPNFAAGGWAKDKTLGFRWRSGSAPPAWATGPLKSAADDALRTAAARSPRFVYRKSAGNSIRYTGTFPSYCGAGIACASRSMPTSWGIWLRPHGTDFGWGTLRWCQKNSSSSGCFDIRRVALHELGHITGLHHPESAGFRLAAHETVMHAVTPAKPQPASTRTALPSRRAMASTAS